MKVSIYMVGALVMATSSIGLLSGCSVESNSWMNESRLEIHEDQFTDSFETAKMDDATLRAVSVYYHRYGNGPLVASVSYDPKSSKNNAGLARHEAQRIEAKLRQAGVNDIQISTTAAPGTGDVSTTVVTFPAITAQAPTGCKMMPGYYKPADISSDADTDEPDYRYGCTVESLIARQVTRPSDLLGKPGYETDADGQRQTNVLDGRGYYGYKPNADLGGEKASDD
ncbi:MAG: hypothetical protein KDJ50_00595 [Alphaproteobacteria bacterium]|nr:hypothetical protein [Alphaproteobacteria bacterium]